MNKSFEIIDDKVIVTNEYGQKTKRNMSDNIEEILITENNIEEIDRLLGNEYNSRKNSEKKIKSERSYLIVSILQFVASFTALLSKSIFSCVCHLMSGACFLVSSYFLGIKPEKKNIKISKIKSSILEKKYLEEKNKLIELKNNITNNAICVATNKKEISISNKIINLNHKLCVIQKYKQNKRKFISYYKKGILRNKLEKYFLCYGYDVDLIEELIINDLTKENKNEIEYQKILKNYN